MSDEKKEAEEAEVPAVEKPVYAGPNTRRSPVEPPVDATPELYPMADSLKSLAPELRKQFGEAVLGDVVYRGDLTVLVTNEKFFEVCQYLRDTPEWAFNFCVDVTAIDYLLMGETPRFENVAHLYSIDHRHRVRVKCPIEEADMKCASLVPLYPGANYMERETYDMYGVDYQGHPDLTRILLADGWEGFPLRKDFPIGGVPSFYFKTGTNPRAGEPADLVPRIREQTTDV